MKFTVEFIIFNNILTLLTHRHTHKAEGREKLINKDQPSYWRADWLDAGTVGKAGKGKNEEVNPHTPTPHPHLWREKSQQIKQSVGQQPVLTAGLTGSSVPSLSSPRSASRSQTAGSSCGPCESLPCTALWCWLSWRTRTEQQGGDTTALYQPGRDDEVIKTQKISYTQLSLPSRVAGRSKPAERLQPGQTPRWSTGGRWSPPAAPHLDRCRPRSAEEECFNQITQKTTTETN